MMKEIDCRFLVFNGEMEVALASRWCRMSPNVTNSGHGALRQRQQRRIVGEEDRPPS